MLRISSIARPARAGALVVSLLPGRIAAAQDVTFGVQDLATFTEAAAVLNEGQTFSGQGFICMSGPPGPEVFWHLFGFGGTALFRTAAQVDISGIEPGTPIQQAILSFILKEEGRPIPQDVTFTSFPATGTLAFTTAPPGNLGSITTPVIGPNPPTPSFVSVDVTSLLAPRVAAGDDWFGLYITGSDLSELGSYATYTFVPGNPPLTLLPDAAEVRLAVTFVPEPAGMLLASLLGGAALLRVRPGASRKVNIHRTPRVFRS